MGQSKDPNYQRNYKKRVRAERMAQGICTACGVEPLKTKYHCVFCAETYKNYARATRAKSPPTWLAPLLKRAS